MNKLDLAMKLISQEVITKTLGMFDSTPRRAWQAAPTLRSAPRPRKIRPLEVTKYQAKLAGRRRANWSGGIPRKFMAQVEKRTPLAAKSSTLHPQSRPLREPSGRAGSPLPEHDSAQSNEVLVSSFRLPPSCYLLPLPAPLMLSISLAPLCWPATPQLHHSTTPPLTPSPSARKKKPTSSPTENDAPHLNRHISLHHHLVKKISRKLTPFAAGVLPATISRPASGADCVHWARVLNLALSPLARQHRRPMGQVSVLTLLPLLDLHRRPPTPRLGGRPLCL